MKADYKAIAIDFDGVIVQWRNTWKELRNRIGLSEEPITLYKDNKLSYSETKYREFQDWMAKGVNKEEIYEIMRDARLNDGVIQALNELKDRLRISIISGAPDMAINCIIERYGLPISEVYANRFYFGSDGILNSWDLWIDDKTGKAGAIEKLASRSGMLSENIIAIGDHKNDISMFELSGYSIAFNSPSEDTIEMADKAISLPMTNLSTFILKELL